MKRSVVLSLLFAFLMISNISAQQAFTENFQSKISTFQEINYDNPFKVIAPTKERSLFGSAQFLEIKDTFLEEKTENKPEQLKLDIQFKDNSYTLLLELNNEFLEGTNIKYSSGNKAPSIKNNLYYWGMVEGKENSLVSLQITQRELMAVISIDDKLFNLGKVSNEDYYVFYQKDDLLNPPSVDCFTDDLLNQFQGPNPGEVDRSMMDANNCVNMYVEVDNSIFTDKGASTVDYITGAFSQVALLYEQESINFGIQELVIWDTNDPYTGPGSSDYLNQFRAAVGSTFNGDLAHLVGYGGGGGIAYVDVLCNPNFGHAYSGINSSYSNVPTYSWTVEVLTHEIGHNLGSSHTHSCVWNGNGTQIDDCGNIYLANNGYTPGSCYDSNNEILPNNGGTIMSYCHLIGGVGINFNNGFGQQPGDLIRDRVYNATCLSACGDACEPGTACNDFDDCTTNDTYDADCNCVGTTVDSDNDGVCDAEDQCPGGDDNIDVDNDGIPDACDDCINVTSTFSPSTLQHIGAGQSVSNLTLSTLADGLSFTVSNINARLSGNPSRRYNEQVTIKYINGSGIESTYGTFTGDQASSVDVTINDLVASVTVSLSDAYDGDSSIEMSISISDASSCPTDVCPDSDGDTVCDSDDLCPGFDDLQDENGNGIPDGCESNCTPQTSNFNDNPLTHIGSGSSSTSVNLTPTSEDVGFTISNLGSKINGNPSTRYIDEVEVSYVDENGATIIYGTFSGNSTSSVNVSISGIVQSISLSLSDGYDGNSETTQSIDMSEVSHCVGIEGTFNSINNSTLSVYPNPFEDQFQIKINGSIANENLLTVFDANGKVIISETRFLNNMTTIQSNQLNGAGIYFVKVITSSGEELYKKVVSIR